jgi:hypothetical protein
MKNLILFGLFAILTAFVTLPCSATDHSTKAELPIYQLKKIDKEIIFSGVEINSNSTELSCYSSLENDSYSLTKDDHKDYAILNEAIILKKSIDTIHAQKYLPYKEKLYKSHKGSYSNKILSFNSFHTIRFS